MRLLVVEDEPKTAAYLKKGLGENGFVIDLAHDGEQALSFAEAAKYDLIVLDIMLPRRDGWAVLDALRAGGNETPVICLTARDAVEDRVKGLRGGADDYLTKPFAFSELLARVHTVLRRSPQRVADVIRIGDLEIDLARQRATRAGRRLDLTQKEFSLLSLLARNPGTVLSRTAIAEQVWDINFDCDTNVVDVHGRQCGGWSRSWCCFWQRPRFLPASSFRRTLAFFRATARPIPAKAVRATGASAAARTL